MQNAYMIQREVQDENNTRWQCVQAFSGVKTATAEKANQLLEGDGNAVDVVCTPSGGEQTVRLTLSKDWNKEISDEALLGAIRDAKNN